MNRHLAIPLALLLASCAAETSAPTPSVVDRLAAIDLDPSGFDSYATYCADIHDRIAAIVDEVDDPDELGRLYIECDRLTQEHCRRTPQTRLSWENPYGEASQAILFRLADLGTPRGTEVLIGLFADEANHFDGETALNVCHAISRCGKPALPHLRELPAEARWKHTLPDLIACIEAGKLYGP